MECEEPATAIHSLPDDALCSIFRVLDTCEYRWVARSEQLSCLVAARFKPPGAGCCSPEEMEEHGIAPYAAAAAVDAALAPLTQLVQLAMSIYSTNRGDVAPSLPDSLLSLTRLQRFCWDVPLLDSPHLSAGEWLASLRHLALPISAGVYSREALSELAPQLEILALVCCPHNKSNPWEEKTAVEWAVGQPGLCRLAVELGWGGTDDDVASAVEAAKEARPDLVIECGERERRLYHGLDALL